MNVRLTGAIGHFWVAHASGVLVLSSRRNDLSGGPGVSSVTHTLRKVREREDAFASTRDPRATQTAIAIVASQ